LSCVLRLTLLRVAEPSLQSILHGGEAELTKGPASSGSVMGASPSQRGDRGPAGRRAAPPSRSRDAVGQHNDRERGFMPAKSFGLRHRSGSPNGPKTRNSRSTPDHARQYRSSVDGGAEPSAMGDNVPGEYTHRQGPRRALTRRACCRSRRAPPSRRTVRRTFRRLNAPTC
jgi:hypothetical protein